MAEEHPSRTGCALVTGGAVRLGATIVRRFAADGWAVAIHARKEGAADTLAEEMTATGAQGCGREVAICSEPDAAAKSLRAGPRKARSLLVFGEQRGRLCL